MDLSVIVCTYNRCESLRTTLEGFARLAIPSGATWELLIVDNNSTDGTQAVVNSFTRNRFANARYLLEKQQGKSFALNAGIAQARGDVLVFTDDDITLHPQWLVHLKSAFDRLDCVGVGGRIVPTWPCKPPDWLQMEGPHRLMQAVVSFDLGDKDCDLHTPPFGANMAFKRSVFEKHGLFRTDLGPTAGRPRRGEDTEFCRRLLKAGERLVYAPGAVVFHPVEQERLQKKYFESWYFDYGRSQVRVDGIPADARCYGGVPRYLLRQLVASLVKWVTTLDGPLRFWHKLQVCQIAGSISESFAVSMHGKAPCAQSLSQAPTLPAREDPPLEDPGARSR